MVIETELQRAGFAIVEDVYTDEEVSGILSLLNAKGIEKKFGVRELLIACPELKEKVFTEKLLNLVDSISPACTTVVKAIYFDKPPSANWIVNWHQDLTVNLKEKRETPNFKNWRVCAERVAVQPSNEILEHIFTTRIHLDDCTKESGALRVVEGSHRNGVIQVRDWLQGNERVEQICEVKAGGVLLMRPLTLHSSRRTENKRNRRVIHLEFCDCELPNGLEWKEGLCFVERFSTKSG
ncbi:MAG: phytanoyl-CoA dioxygenase family protein [Ignavibacteriae bacterium]|nr:phytanoyl-CoA dioxygenase family protein [Ignavibacteriota bacterium]MCB9216698.1 phytanoyl-CoA dioxygenase family protein [Ignavibacteria bacterium]